MYIINVNSSHQNVGLCIGYRMCIEGIFVVDGRCSNYCKSLNHFDTIHGKNNIAL